MAEGKVFDVKSDTSVDEIIQHFNQKGVYYEATRHSWALVMLVMVRSGPSRVHVTFMAWAQEVWAERYQTYCKSYSLSNWQALEPCTPVFVGAKRRMTGRKFVRFHAKKNCWRLEFRS